MITLIPLDKKADKAEKMAVKLGFRKSFAYGDFNNTPCLCLVPERNYQKGGSIVNTKEFGLVFIQLAEDIGAAELA